MFHVDKIVAREKDAYRIHGKMKRPICEGWAEWNVSVRVLCLRAKMYIMWKQNEPRARRKQGVRQVKGKCRTAELLVGLLICLFTILFTSNKSSPNQTQTLKSVPFTAVLNYCLLLPSISSPLPPHCSSSPNTSFCLRFMFSKSKSLPVMRL